MGFALQSCVEHIFGQDIKTFLITVQFEHKELFTQPLN